MERTMSQIKEQYELETFLADKLRNSTKEERESLYSSVYNELFSKIKHHPQLTRKISEEESRKDVERQLWFLKRFLKKEATYMEIGAGDCKLTYEVAGLVKKTIAIDVSSEITKSGKAPENFQLIISDGSSIPVPTNSVHVVYSNQLMEHLHEEDAFEQLKNIFNALTENGCYVCITPNRLSGPHDISAYFDNYARGFHLKEYTYYELNQLFHKAGFAKTKAFTGNKKIFVRIPLFLIFPYEKFLELLSFSIRKKLLKFTLFRFILHIRLVGIKSTTK
jgi:ubiquinone/menaquinone biosynthesis C-methylase UbiE